MGSTYTQDRVRYIQAVQ